MRAADETYLSGQGAGVYRLASECGQVDGFAIRWNDNMATEATFHVDIPASVAGSIQLPAAEVEERLRMELAVALYGQGILSFGKAFELAEMSRYAFADVISDRGIPRHYTEHELAQDQQYARGL